jgi:hypothetical protein
MRLLVDTNIFPKFYRSRTGPRRGELTDKSPASRPSSHQPSKKSLINSSVKSRFREVVVTEASIHLEDSFFSDGLKQPHRWKPYSRTLGRLDR